MILGISNGLLNLIVAMVMSTAALLAFYNCLPQTIPAAPRVPIKLQATSVGVVAILFLVGYAVLGS